MPFPVAWANGQVLSSSAHSPAQMEAIFQTLTIWILGLDSIPAVNPAASNALVRCAWQEAGQPAWKITEDVVIIQANPEADPVTRIRDGGLTPNDDVSVLQVMSYTQVWRMHFEFWGPNSFLNATMTVAAFGNATDFVFNWLVNGSGGAALWPIYVIADFPEPLWVPELFQRKWWPRATLDLKFNELVIQEITVPTAVSAHITLTADNGVTETFDIVAPQLPSRS
jgi:hypothetical protein